MRVIKTQVVILIALFMGGISVHLGAITLKVGPNQAFSNPAQAAAMAKPGDTILIFPNVYSGGYFIGNLHGEATKYIYFVGVDAGSVIFQGNSQAFHFSDVSYIHIENLSITGQTGNGVNMDDGGTFDTPSHHIRIKKCRFYDMGAQGNNDLLKMSGVDDFEVSECVFRNGANGGSGIDMVGCHRGVFRQNYFENMGSNSIQAKGGTQYITISANWFLNGGQRTLNLGGSTGLQFFRPQDARFEAADIDVFANVFIGSWAPVAYVGCVRVQVVNNTIVQPQNWVIRILQETVDPDRFFPCGENSFVNNIVYHGTSLSRHVNIGSNTASNTFTFSNNLWYNVDNPDASTPQLPVAESKGIYGFNPDFVNVALQEFSLKSTSPAVDAGTVTAFTTDYSGNMIPMGSGFDIGAFEFEQTSDAGNLTGNDKEIPAFPNPFEAHLTIVNGKNARERCLLVSISGQEAHDFGEIDGNTRKTIPTENLHSGAYLLFLGTRTYILIKR